MYYGENTMITKQKDTVNTKYISDIEQESVHLIEVANNTEKETQELYPRMLNEHNTAEMQETAESLKRATSNITKALTKTYRVSDEFNARLKDIKKQKQFMSPPANAAIDFSESKSNHFAKGLNLYKILLICYVGSFVGVIVELFWCLITKGYIESRSGLVYGPFNLLYGAGAVLMSICLYKFRNRNGWISFLGGMLVGSVLEYICSWGQEMIFGSRSWSYYHMPFNINGRICLLFSIFWGILGVLWIKYIYPFMAKCILKIPNLAGKIITWVLTVFFIFNGLMTLASMTRWTQRMDGLEPKTSFGEFIDERFPDERMERIFANMKFTKNQDQ